MGITTGAIALARKQGGVVTRAQSVELGHSLSSIDWLVRAKTLTVVGSGVYRVFPALDHLDLVHGAVVALPGAVVSHQSAAHILRFPKLPDHPNSRGAQSHHPSVSRRDGPAL